MRLVSFPLAALLSLSLTACPEDPPPHPPDDEVPVTPPAPEPTPPIAPAPDAKTDGQHSPDAKTSAGVDRPSTAA